MTWHPPSICNDMWNQNIFAFVYFVITFPIIKWGGDWIVKDLDYGQRHKGSNFNLDILLL